MAGGAVTRFAPSPTGPLHLGHAYAALVAQARGEVMLLRIEDLDQSRCRPAWEAQIYEDLAWLGLTWPKPVLRQSARGAAYHAALAQLDALGLTYRCRCSRADIRAALDAPQEGAPVLGPDGLVYPGTCRGGQEGAVIRLDMGRALAALPALPRFAESGVAHAGGYTFEPAWMQAHVGDVVLARAEHVAYHLAVVVDDAAQGVTEVTRGADLFEATFIHVLLQALLGLPTPAYHHHDLIRDAAGKRLAKRDDARAIALYRAEGATASEVRALVGF